MRNGKTIGEMLRFGIVGVLATAFHYLIYYGLIQLPIDATWWDNTAYATGYIVSFFGNFYATSVFTFRSAPSWSKLVGMAGAHGVNFLLHMVLFNVFLGMGIAKAWVPLPVYAIAIPVNFLLVRFVFKHKEQNAEEHDTRNNETEASSAKDEQ